MVRDDNCQMDERFTQLSIYTWRNSLEPFTSIFKIYDKQVIL